MHYVIVGFALKPTLFVKKTHITNKKEKYLG